MPHPEGYRKALRLMKMVIAKFNMPILTMVDTSGAYPGVEAEERGQLKPLHVTHTKCPIYQCLLLSPLRGRHLVGSDRHNRWDRILMMEHSCYSVITGELFNHPF